MEARRLTDSGTTLGLDVDLGPEFPVRVAPVALHLGVLVSQIRSSKTVSGYE